MQCTGSPLRNENLLLTTVDKQVNMVVEIITSRPIVCSNVTKEDVTIGKEVRPKNVITFVYIYQLEYVKQVSLKNCTSIRKVLARFCH